MLATVKGGWGNGVIYYDHADHLTGANVISQTALNYMGARYYTGGKGRFLSEDPAFLAVGSPDLKQKTGLELQKYLENPQTHNSYSYTANNPLRYVDKEGEWLDTVVDIAAIAYSGYKLGQAVVNGGDVRGEAGNLALDVGGVFIPGVAGLGTLRRIEKAADIAGDAGKTLGKSPLPDSALVCRGGSCSAQRFKDGAGVTIDSSGKLSGVSVNSAPGKSLEELTVSIPHKQVGVTTVGKIRQAGGDVVKKPMQNNPVHSELSGITPKQAEQLFTPTKRNPNIK